MAFTMKLIEVSRNHQFVIKVHRRDDYWHSSRPDFLDAYRLRIRERLGFGTACKVAII
jgi:hypothetical protein